MFRIRLKPQILRPVVCLCLTLLTILPQMLQAQTKPVRQAPVPAWVQPIAPDYNAELDEAASTGPYYYLLLSTQEHIAKEQLCGRYAVRVLNNEGIQEMSDISITFDPSYQEFVIHEIKVIREGEEIDKLKDHRFAVAQRETNMERHLYDGSLTAYMNLSDIRVNDVIEYCYSLIGFNPIYAGNYSSTFYMNYTVPVDRNYVRVICPPSTNLQLGGSPNAPDAVETENAQEKTYTWDLKEVDALRYDVNTPPWFHLNDYIELSSYADWKAVVDWGVPLYRSSEAERDALKNQMFSNITHTDPDSIIKQAVRFTQDQVRYLGLENGIHGIQPTAPKQVFDQRYGDCKAKSFFLAELLKAHGIKAAPMLVHSSRGRIIKNALPSPDHFDHCVVYLEKEGVDYFVDPTISNQGGDLAQQFFPNYDAGLIIEAGRTGLVELPEKQISRTEIVEDYSLDEVGKGCRMKVKTIYSGAAADQQRDYFRSNNRSTIQKNYIDFYSRVYPDIAPVGDIDVEDQRDPDNRFIVKEEYNITELWTRSETNSSVLSCDFYPIAFERYAYPTKSPTRTMPYYVGAPSEFTYQSLIRVPESWNAANRTLKLKHDAFEYDYKVSMSGRTIQVDHQYRSLKSFIAAEDVTGYLKEHEKITDQISYQLTYDESASGYQYSSSDSSDSTSVWTKVLILWVVFGIIFLAVKFGGRLGR